MPLMGKSLDEVVQDAANLTEQDRLKLARIMLDLSESQPEASEQLQADWEEEIQRRLAQLRSGQVKAVPMEEVKKQIENQFNW